MILPNDIIRGNPLPDPTHTMMVHFKVLGGHTHLRIFTGPVNRGRGKAGDLVMTNEEFNAWRNGTLSVAFTEDYEEVP